MKKTILIALLSALLSSSIFSKNKASEKQAFNHDHGYHQVCSLKSSGRSEPSYIGPRNYAEQDRLVLHALNNPISWLDTPKLSKAVFNFTFDESVKEDTKTAATYAASLWANILTTDETIEVYVIEASDDESTTLASAFAYDRELSGPTSYLPVHYDPVAITNRKAGADLFEGRPDIVINVNKDQAFYYGTDGNCPNDKHDLVSILLHELGHGLGFYDSISGDENYDTDSTANYGYSTGFAFAFDNFLTNGEGTPVIEGVAPQIDSPELFKRVSNNNLYFGGPLTLSLTDSVGAKMWAPIIWSAGSSIAHLNEVAYRNGNENSLMTPTASEGEVIHDPGPLAIAILKDIGWDHVWINHTKVADTEDISAIIPFEAQVQADSELSGPPTVNFRLQGAENLNFQSLPMATNVETGTFFLPFQLTGVPAKYEYYISVPVTSNRVFDYPAKGPETPIVLNVGPDDVAPVVTHTPERYHFSHRQIVAFEASANDNIAMGGIHVDVWLDEVLLGTVAAELNPTTGTYVALIGMPDMTGRTAIHYRFNAYDASAAQNTAVFPAVGTYTLPIQQMKAPVSAYTNNLDLMGDDFILEGFRVNALEGFTSPSLGTIHPYLNNGDQIDYYAYMRQPIIIQPGMRMSFDEIVLVEPASEGNVFGDDEFWDYVAVEASSDRGRTWTAITAGWDSGANITWNTAYNDGIAEGEQDSEAIGSPEMYRTRTILFDQSEVLTPGTEVMLRFHLFSDPYAVGWGWEIDNIVISQ